MSAWALPFFNVMIKNPTILDLARWLLKNSPRVQGSGNLECGEMSQLLLGFVEMDPLRVSS
jgi:hypothetical protein